VDPTTAQKIALRDRILTSRRRRGLLELGEAAEAVASHLLAWEPVRRAATVAAYASVATEPGTGPLLDGLLATGRRVLLPVLLPDDDLDWAEHTGPLARAARGLLQPAGPRLGPHAVATADVVIVPGLAVDATGMRLGRGGGSYDRALARVPVGTPVCVLLYDDEVVERVPADSHDRGVTAAATPSGIRWFRPTAA
jgi:5-formyltetrahydrofolate cyclo-ligase